MITRRTFTTFALAFLVTATVGVAHANLIANGDFSANASSYGTYPGYNGGSNPSAPTSWTPTVSAPGNSGVNGPATGSGNTFGPANPAGVNNFLFLQNNTGGTSSAQQSLNLVANTNYTLTFSAAGRATYGLEKFGVQVNDNAGPVVNTTAQGSFGAVDSAFHNYVVNFTATANGTGSVGFSNDVISGDHTVDISNVVLNATALPVVLNSGFEAPSLGAGGFREGNPAAGWTAVGPSAAGIVGNGSAYGNSDAPEGIQAGLLKANGGMSQVINGFGIGQAYEVRFWAEARTNFNGADPIQVKFDGNIVTFNGGASTLTPTGSYVLYTSDAFVATQTSYTLQLLGTSNLDNSSFIDNVSVVVPEPGSFVLLGLGVVGLVVAARRRRKV